MAWDYDKPPIEYLSRRLLYYKRKKKIVENFMFKESAWARWGNSLPELVTRRVIQIEKRIKDYQKAILILEQHGKAKRQKK